MKAHVFLFYHTNDLGIIHVYFHIYWIFLLHFSISFCCMDIICCHGLGGWVGFSHSSYKKSPHRLLSHQYFMRENIERHLNSKEEEIYLHRFINPGNQNIVIFCKYFNFIQYAALYGFLNRQVLQMVKISLKEKVIL